MTKRLHRFPRPRIPRAWASGRFRFLRCAPALLVLVVVAASGLHAQNPQPVVGSSVPPAPQPSPTSPVWVPRFAFHSGFWVNLHHFLFLQARLQEGRAGTAGNQRSFPAQQAANLSDLPPSERRPWQDAVNYYAENFAGRDLPYDSFLVRVDDRLSEMGSCPDLTGQSSPACASGINPSLAAVLEEAAPVYRAHWWPEQNRANEAWISHTRDLLRQYGDKPAQALSRVFENTWPSDPIPVDVVSYAGAFGAYTTLDPLHIVLASGNPSNQGFAALEVTLREASHVLAEPIRGEIIEQCRQQTKPVPHDLWHALASYTTAQVFEQSFAGQPLPSGVTLASLSEDNRKYMVARGWQVYQQILRQVWQPYLNGQTDMQFAIVQMVNEL